MVRDAELAAPTGNQGGPPAAQHQAGPGACLHTAIYLVLAAGTCFVLYAGITGYRGVWLNGALVLVTIEGVVFVGNGMKCPLTAVAQRYGAEKGYVFDTFLPERLARHTFWFFGTLLAAGLLLIVIRMALA